MAEPLVRERFAPSPTGPLHLGHAYSALLAHDAAMAAGGRFMLRIEDIDTPRCRPEYEQGIYDDLAWLGLSWHPQVIRQSERMSEYDRALQRLYELGLTYRCTCTRRDIKQALSAPQEGVPLGPDGPVYPGTCRHRYSVGGEAAIRLNMDRALGFLPKESGYHELGKDAGYHALDPEFMLGHIGDIVLARRDLGTSYHLSVVVDDAFQGITHVTRGEDLAPATPIHVLLQKLLDLPTPVYRHHRLIRDAQGKRLAKRDDARAIAKFRAEGASPADIRAMIGL